MFRELLSKYLANFRVQRESAQNMYMCVFRVQMHITYFTNITFQLKNIEKKLRAEYCDTRK